jgi:hypothetical protein
MRKTIVLGAEFDENLRRTLVQLMRELGATTLDSDWSLVGSQDVASAKLEVRGRIIEVVSETYMGLSITGDEADVNEIAARIAGRTTS